MNMTGFMPNDYKRSRDAFVQHKSNAVKAARDLGYGVEVVKMVEKAKTSEEINRIMKRARAERFGN